MATLRLKDILKQRKISHRKFSQLLGVERGTLARYLRPDYNPTLATLEKIAKALGLKVRDLLKE